MNADVVARAFHLEDKHPNSHRYAILEDNGTTLWLYLTAPDDPTVVSQTWIFSHKPPIESHEWPLFQGERPMFPPEEPPPIELVFDRPEVHSWRFDWSSDGEAVALFCDTEPVALVRSTHKTGFSRNVIRAGPWGVPWCARTFHDVFGMTPE